MTLLQIVLRALSAPILVVSLLLGVGYLNSALQGGTLQLGLSVGLAVLAVLGGAVLSAGLWWMGDIHKYLSDLSSDA